MTRCKPTPRIPGDPRSHAEERVGPPHHGPAGHDRVAAESGALSSTPGSRSRAVLSRDGVEETVAVVRDDHHCVAAGARMRRESNTEESADRRVRDAPSGFGRRRHGGGENPLPYLPLVRGELRLRLRTPGRSLLLHPLRQAAVIHTYAGSPKEIRQGQRPDIPVAWCFTGRPSAGYSARSGVMARREAPWRPWSSRGSPVTRNRRCSRPGWRTCTWRCTGIVRRPGRWPQAA